MAALLKNTQYVPKPCLMFLDPEVDCPRWACGSNVLHDFHVALLQLSSTEQRDLTVKECQLYNTESCRLRTEGRTLLIKQGELPLDLSSKSINGIRAVCSGP